MSLKITEKLLFAQFITINQIHVVENDESLILWPFVQHSKMIAPFPKKDYPNINLFY